MARSPSRQEPLFTFPSDHTGRQGKPGHNLPAMVLRPQVELPVYSFTGLPKEIGEDPVGQPVVSQNVLYGTTAGGGASSGGTIFQYNAASQTENVLHSFAGMHPDLP